MGETDVLHPGTSQGLPTVPVPYPTASSAVVFSCIFSYSCDGGGVVPERKRKGDSRRMGWWRREESCGVLGRSRAGCA